MSAAAKNVHQLAPTPRQLDVHTLGVIRDRLKSARLDVHMAYLHARGNPEARATILAAGEPLRAALDAFEAAYRRGRL